MEVLHVFAVEAGELAVTDPGVASAVGEPVLRFAIGMEKAIVRDLRGQKRSRESQRRQLRVPIPKNQRGLLPPGYWGGLSELRYETTSATCWADSLPSNDGMSALTRIV